MHNHLLELIYIIISRAIQLQTDTAGSEPLGVCKYLAVLPAEQRLNSKKNKINGFKCSADQESAPVVIWISRFLWLGNGRNEKGRRISIIWCTGGKEKRFYFGLVPPASGCGSGIQTDRDSALLFRFEQKKADEEKGGEICQRFAEWSWHLKKKKKKVHKAQICAAACGCKNKWISSSGRSSAHRIGWRDL